MWKKIRYLSYFLVFLSLVVFIYNGRDFYLVPLIQSQLNSLTGNKLQFRSFAVSLPFKLHVYDLNYDNKVLIDSAEFGLNPLKIINKPLYIINSVNIEKTRITIKLNADDKNNVAEKLNIQKINSFIKKLNSKIFIKETNIVYHGSLTSLKNTELILDKNIKIKSDIEYKYHSANLEGNIDILNNEVKPDFNVKINGQIKCDFELKGFYDLSSNYFNFTADAGSLSVNRFVFGKSRVLLTKNSGGFEIYSEGDFGSLNFKSSDLKFDVFSSSGSIKIKDKENIVDTNLNYVSTMNGGALNLSVVTNDIMLFGKNCGNLKVEADNQNGQLNLNCSHNAGSNIKAVIKKDGQYLVDLYDKKTIGYFSGNYNYGTFSINIKKLPLSRLSLMRAYDKNIKGYLSLYGDIDKEKGSVKINIDNINSQRIKNLSGAGQISKQNYQWMFDFITKDKKLSFNGFYKNRQNYKIDANYDNVDITTILKLFNGKIPITGYMSGYVKYNSNFDFPTQINVRAKNGTLYGNKYNTCELAGEISSKTIQISTFTLSGADANVSLKSMIDFNDNNSASYLYCDIKDFKAGSVNVNSKLYFEGKISKSNEISGQLMIPKAFLNDIDFSGLNADILLSRKKIEITNINNKNGLSGNFAYDFTARRYDSSLKISKADISKHIAGIQGNLYSDFELNGFSANPDLKISFNLKQGIFSGVDFNSSGDFEYKNKNGKLNKFSVISGKTNISGNGVIKSNNNIDISFKINNITEKIINNYVNFRTPVAGIFNGTGKIYGMLNSPKCLLNLYSKNVYFKKLKLNDFNAEVLLADKKITLRKSSVKLYDSQLNLNGTFNTHSKLYSFMFNFVNAHIGPFDIFGNLNLNGKMNILKGAAVYNGDIELDNLWINREKVDFLKFNYTINGKKINLKTPKNSPLEISGAVDFSKYPQLKFEKILFCHDTQSCYFDGDSSTNNLNVSTTWKSLDGLFLSHLFNLPFELDGKLDVKLKAAGTISNPNISCVLNSKSGNIENIYYDTLDIDVKVKNNMLSINTVQIQKSGDYTANIRGSFPFWIDPAVKKDMLNKKINIEYDLKDNKLKVLSSFTKDKIKIKKGNLQLTGSITGTRKNIVHKADLQMAASNVNTDSYIEKIKNLEISAVLKNNIISIQKFTANAGSGKLNVDGDIHFVGTTPSFYNLSVYTSKKGIPIVIKDLPIPTSGVLKMEKNETFANYSKGTPKFSFKIYGPATDFNLTGWAELENTRFCYPPPKNFTADSPADLGLLENCHINIDLKAALNTRYENSFANLFLKGQINLKGKIDGINTNGVVESDNGKIFYMGNDLNVVYSKVEIINNEIFISGEADTEVYNTGDSMPDTVKIYIDRSTVDNLKTRFVSKNDPTLDSNKVLARVTKTDPTQRQILDTNTDYLVKQQVVRMFSSNIATPLANTVLKKTGIIDNVRLGYVNTDNLQVASGNEPTIAEILYGMKYSVEKNINRNLQLGYSVTFDQLNRELDLKHALEMSVRLNPFLFLKGSYGLRSEDPQYKPENVIMLEQRFRFGGSSK